MAEIDHSKTETTHTSGTMNPIPMSFPAVLRNMRLSDRYMHLANGPKEGVTDETEGAQLRKKRAREDREGKRWVRRKENSRFTGNAHIIAPTSRDLFVEPPSARSTFVSSTIIT